MFRKHVSFEKFVFLGFCRKTFIFLKVKTERINILGQVTMCNGIARSDEPKENHRSFSLVYREL